VNDVSVIERLVKAARQRGGERLELVADKPAVLVTGSTRLHAGTAVLGSEAIESWLEAIVGGDRWVAFELGEEVVGDAPVAGEIVPFRARRVAGTLQATLDLQGARPAPPAVGPVATPAPPAPAVKPRPATTPPTDPTARPAAAASVPQKTPEATAVLERPLDRMLRRLVELNGSDLHLTAGFAPFMRLYGDIAPMPDFRLPLSSEHIMLMADEVAPADNRREFRATSDTDFAYEIKGLARFRVNVFRDRRGVCAVFRQIPESIMRFEQLGLPECVKTLCMLSKGLVLVTGPTGSGKSTTLATMIDHVNENRSDHIITIEDPIEFVHENKRCLVNQRQVNAHTESFRKALRAALREDPDIVLVGELRDLDTMAIAIETAETGHLVFGTLHTTTAVSTVDRLVDQFPPDRQDQVRMMVSESLKGVIAQVLCKRIGRGRIAAYEILLGVPAVSNLIREGKTHQLQTVIQTSRRLGMRTLNDSLVDLVKRGYVELDEALSKSADKDGLRNALKLGTEEGPAAAD
jgi:twitching motility protein PilT